MSRITPRFVGVTDVRTRDFAVSYVSNTTRHFNRHDIMETPKKTIITISTNIQAPIDKVWEYYTEPSHVMRWNHASDDWHSPRGKNDLRKGGKFNYHMAAIDGSQGFDFEGVYTDVVDQK